MSKASNSGDDTQKNSSRIVEIFSQKLHALCEKNGMTKYRLFQLTGVTQTNLAHYMVGKSAPSLATLEKISRAFGLTPAQFLSESGTDIEQSPEQREVASLWAELNLEDRNIVLRVIQGLKLAETSRTEE
ncbi:MAG: helix-turn-helix domain-containing protein [Lachnospiraceae bacterium]|nr:helix-turn-helix domain-containing protein [Lachnospiraceae bacterium]